MLEFPGGHMYAVLRADVGNDVVLVMAGEKVTGEFREVAGL